MKLSDLDASKFLYDPRDGRVEEKLRKYKEFRRSPGKLPRGKVVQYIILMYDVSNDDIRGEFPYYPQRKREICKMVGLVGGNNKKLEKYAEDMMVGKNETINNMIIRYLTLFNNPDLLMLASYYEMYIQINKEALRGQYSKDTISNIEKLNLQIKELTDRIFRGKDETELRAELYKAIEEQSLGIRPEEVAERIQKDDSIKKDWSPYGGYSLDDLKFTGDE